MLSYARRERYARGVEAERAVACAGACRQRRECVMRIKSDEACQRADGATLHYRDERGARFADMSFD